MHDGNGPLGMVYVQTPFRISFFGGGTDLPEFFNTHGGAVLGVALNKYSYVTVNSLVRFLSKRIKLSYSKLELADSPAELEHPILRCVLHEYPDLWTGNFLDIHSFADLPSQSGVGSSSSFTVGLLQALYALNGKYRSPRELAMEAIAVERRKLGEKGGWQDQILAAYGGFNRIDFSHDMFVVTPLCLPASVRNAVEASLLFCFTNSQRESARIQDRTFTTANLKAKEAVMLRLLELVDAAQACLYSQHSSDDIVESFGALLDEAWSLKRALSDVVSNPHTDACYAAARRAGAYGGKVCGAGGGGCMFFVVPRDRKEAVRKALKHCKAEDVDVGFSPTGSRVVFSTV